MCFGEVVCIFVGELRLLAPCREGRSGGTAKKRGSAEGKQMTARQVH